MTVKSDFSLHRTYIIFRTLGLRHLTVTSIDGYEVAGIITRRDLMGYSLEAKLDHTKQNLKNFTVLAKTVRALTSSRLALNKLNSTTDVARNVNEGASGSQQPGPSGLAPLKKFPNRTKAALNVKKPPHAKALSPQSVIIETDNERNVSEVSVTASPMKQRGPFSRPLDSSENLEQLTSVSVLDGHHIHPSTKTIRVDISPNKNTNHTDVPPIDIDPPLLDLGDDHAERISAEDSADTVDFADAFAHRT